MDSHLILRRDTLVDEEISNFLALISLKLHYRTVLLVNHDNTVTVEGLHRKWNRESKPNIPSWSTSGSSLDWIEGEYQTLWLSTSGRFSVGFGYLKQSSKQLSSKRRTDKLRRGCLCSNIKLVVFHRPLLGESCWHHKSWRIAIFLRFSHRWSKGQLLWISSMMYPSYKPTIENILILSPSLIKTKSSFASFYRRKVTRAGKLELS